MDKDLKRDIIAILLAALIIGTVAFRTLLPDAFAGRPTTTLSLDDVSKHLDRMVNGTNVIRFDSRSLEPAVYKALAYSINDYGASNDLLYVAQLIEIYNNGGGLDPLREALAIVNDVREQHGRSQ